jgi:hypothetical protein
MVYPLGGSIFVLPNSTWNCELDKKLDLEKKSVELLLCLFSVLLTLFRRKLRVNPSPLPPYPPA